MLPENAPGRKKFSLFALVLIAVSLTTAIYLPFSLVMDIEDNRAKLTFQREKKLKLYINFAEQLYRAGAEPELDAMLTEALDQKDISYFLVYRNNLLAYARPIRDDLAIDTPYSVRKTRAGKDFIDKDFSERTQMLADDTMLTLGIDKRDASPIQTIFSGDLWKVLLQDILILISLAAGTFWLHTRDLQRLKKEIENTGRIQSDPNRTHSSDLQAISAGLQGLQNQEKALKSENLKLNNQVLPALQRELFSGKEPPYTFECSLVRTDINGFSAIFNSPYRDRFAEHIDSFFEGLSEIVSRYDGLIYEFVGDEVIYYFKDQQLKAQSQHDQQLDDQHLQDQTVLTSTQVAINAIRDIHSLAKEINARVATDGHAFTVKSALAHGTLRFAQQVDGFSLSGGVLIETVRILSTVTEKNDNTLYLAERHLDAVRRPDQFEQIGIFELKGYSDKVVLLRWLGDEPVSHHLASVKAAGFRFLQSYRSDKALLETIEEAISEMKSFNLEMQLALVAELKTLTVYRVHYRLAPSLISWLEHAGERSTQNPEWIKLVSAIIMLFPLLVPSDDILEQEAERLERFLDSRDPRTVANTVEVLRTFRVNPKARLIPKLFVSPHNRVAANALVHAGSRELTKEILSKLGSMILDSVDNDSRRASGLYALGEIARILKEQDPVYYSTRIDLHRLLGQIAKFESARNRSVATQARTARTKVAS